MRVLIRYGTCILLLVLCASACSAGRHHSPAAAMDATAGVTAALYQQYSEWKGVRYRYGGLSKSGVDCSGFVYLTLKRHFGLKVPRNTRELSSYGDAVSRSGLAPGDLVFFKIGASKRHVGIYVEDGKFLHASTSKGVMLSDMEDGYWSGRFWKARRVL